MMENNDRTTELSQIESLFNNTIDEKYQNDFKKNKDKIIEYLLKNKDKVLITKKTFGIIEMVDILESQEKQDEIKAVEVTDVINTVKCDEQFISIIDKYLSRDVTSMQLPYEVLKKIDLSSFNKLNELDISGFNIEIDKDSLNSIPQNIYIISGNFKFDEEVLKDSIFTKDFSPSIYYNGKVIKNKSSFTTEHINLYCANPYEDIDEIIKFSTEIYPQGVVSLRVDNTVDKDILGLNSVISYNCDKEDCSILTLSNVNSISDVLKVKDCFLKNNKKIDRIVVNLENKTYDDIYLLKSLKSHNVMIKYSGSLHEISISDFIAMRETLDYYKSLILEANLSDFEKLIYAYDLIKSFEYKEVEEGDSRHISRNISSIVREGKIVCVGYSVFLAQLLRELGIESYVISTEVPVDDEIAGHERNLIKIDDEKYNIHGTYAVDCTWDSAKNLVECIDKDGQVVFRRGNNQVLEDDTIIKYHDNLSSYRYFMVPGDKYQTVFKGEKMPDFKFADKYSNNITDLLFEKDDSVYKEDKLDFLSSKDIQKEKFINAVRNVRFKEGYSFDTIEESLDSVIAINRINIEEDELTLGR